jgi:VCBS repeat-containing protein
MLEPGAAPIMVERGSPSSSPTPSASKREDEVAAHELLFGLAELGDAAAQFNLGFMYYYGLGVDQNHVEAGKWYRQAAEQDFADAQFALGIIFESGIGLPQDLVQAHRWYNLAAKNAPPGETRVTFIKHRDRLAKQLASDQPATTESGTAPTDLALSNGAVEEHVASGTEVGRVSAGDPDADESFTYSLIEDAGGRFAIDPDSGRLTVGGGAGLDFEDAAGHEITVRVTDSDGLSYDEALAINVVDVNEAPRAEEAAFVVDENVADGTAVGRISASDPDAVERFIFSLMEDAEGRFAVDAGTGAITVADGARLDFEGTGSFALTVGVTDSGGLSDSATVTVNLNDINEAPGDIHMTGGTVAEDAARQTLVATFAAIDPDAEESLTYKLIEDADGRFEIDPDSDRLTVGGGAGLDFEDAAGHEITVRVTDSDGLSYDEALAITVVDVNETPRAEEAAFVVDENVADGTAVGQVTAGDPDAGERLTYNLTEDAGGRFAIDPDSGRLTVVDDARLDFEDAAGHQVTVQVTDSGGLNDNATVTVELNDVNEAPRVEEAVFVVAENAAAATPVGQISASDPDTGERLTYSLTEDAGGRFAIDPDSGRLTVADGTRLDFEGTPSFALAVGVTDRGGLSDSATVTVKLNDVNEAPSDIAMTGGKVAEQAAAGTAVGKVSASDPDAGERVTYSLTEDAEGRFAIDPDSGRLTVTGRTRLDFEAAASHEITVRVTDSGGLSYGQALVIAVVDVNEAPSEITMTGGKVAEQAAAGALVATLATVDPDAGESLAYSLIEDAGGRFAIDRETGAITVADGAGLDFEDATDHEVMVRVTDSSGLSYDKTFVVTVSDKNYAPTDLALSDGTVVEYAAVGTLVGRVSASDPDAGERFTYSLIEDADGRFAIDPDSGRLTVVGDRLIVYDLAASHEVTVQVTDSGGKLHRDIHGRCRQQELCPDRFGTVERCGRGACAIGDCGGQGERHGLRYEGALHLQPDRRRRRTLCHRRQDRSHNGGGRDAPRLRGYRRP